MIDELEPKIENKDTTQKDTKILEGLKSMNKKKRKTKRKRKRY